MKERIASATVTRKSIIVMLFSLITVIGFSFKTNAQGWTFTFQLAESGPCGGGSLPVLPTFPNFGFPTQNQCESMRQTILGISASAPMYNSHGDYIGDCKVYYSCTPCSGSDIVTPGQVNPGDVSLDGESQGKPFFTTHQSEAFEDWARDYKQLLQSYGITSILGKTFDALHIPMTGDKNFDKFYSGQSSEFNPPAPAGNNTITNQDASVVDLSGKKGTVQLLTTEEEQKQRDKWYQDHLQDQGYTNLGQFNAREGLDPNQSPTWDENSSVYKGVQGMIDKIGEYPGGALPAYIGNLELNLAKNVFQYLDQVNESLKNGTTDELATNNPNPGQTIVMETMQDQVNNRINEIKDNAISSMQQATVNAGERVMGSLYGSKGASDYRSSLNVINTATGIFDKVKSAANWLGTNGNNNQ